MEHMYTTYNNITAESTVINNKTPRPKRLETLLAKYKANGHTKVLDFLDSKGRKSKRTVIAYSLALGYFNRFLEQYYKGYNVETILKPLLHSQQKIDVYKLLNSFVSYLQNDTVNGHNLSALTIKLYMTGVKSYLSYYDIEITPNKFKNRVTLPTVYREDEEAVDANDIRNMLNVCSNRRLKTYLLVLASGGMRAVEALAIRLCDINFSVNPTQIRIRKEYAKTKRERTIFISDEATRFLQQWIDWKYRNKHAEHKHLKNKIRNENDLVFSFKSSIDPHGLYFKVLIEFQKVLQQAGLTSRKEDGVYKRRKITFHSLRRFVKTTIANQHNSDFSEWFIGHKKSTYYTNKKEELAKAYKEKCMRYLTFLDYPTVEATGQSYAAQLEQKDKEIDQLKRLDKINSEAIIKLQEQLNKIQDQISSFQQLTGIQAIKKESKKESK
jgi:integrase